MEHNHKYIKKYNESKFENKIYSLVKKIPKGKITTYKEIGRALDTKAYRAIGMILSKNKNSFLTHGNTPCHRVVKSDGTIGGFHRHTTGRNILIKKRLLQNEEITVYKNNKIKDFKKRLFKFN